MALIPGGHIRWVFSANNVGGERINTGYWVATNDVTPTQAVLDAIAVQVAGYWNTTASGIAPYCYPGVSWLNVNGYYYDGTSNSAFMQTIAPLAANPGTLAGAGSPIDTCLVVSLRTGFPGRSRRGRMYLPFHNTVGAASGQTTSGIAAAYAGAVASGMNSYSAGHPGWAAVVSRTLGDSRAISLASCNTVPDVQRRRENKLSPASNPGVVVSM